MHDPPKLIYIESEDGNLFTGIAPGLPTMRYSPKQKAFVEFDGGPKPEGWGEKIDEARALELMGH